MSASETSSSPRPKKRAWIIAIIALVAVVAAAFWFGRSQPDTTNSATTPPPSPVETSEAPVATPSTDTGSAGYGPSGCAGGSVVNADMVLNAQAEAPHNSDGAVELAATFVRWLVRDPLPSVEEADEVGPAILAKDAFTDDLGAFITQATPLNSDARESSSVTFANGAWMIDRAEEDHMRVVIGGHLIEDGAISTTTGYSRTVDLVWEQNSWHVLKASNYEDIDLLFKNGVKFEGGC